MNHSKTILVAPLNWGLGHATRCIPIIRALLKNGYRPLLASDGVALSLLQKEFPELDSIELASYNIEYAKNGKFFKSKLLLDMPKMICAIMRERKFVKQLVDEGKIHGIISDNRLGVYDKRIPSIFITHQLNVLTGNTTYLTSKMHHWFIKKFNECWVPDFEEADNLSGRLGHLKNKNIKILYIGPLSRFEKNDTEKIYDLMVILSGPEPQRTMLEDKLFNEIKSYQGKVLFIRGKIEAKQEIFNFLNTTVYNFMTSGELEKAINASDLVLSRSGYTTIMDLAKLEKKAFFIPTPGQYEQEYLAERLHFKGIVPSAKQAHFSIKSLAKTELFTGLKNFGKPTEDLDRLFHLFEGK
ncbi:MAG: glycosyltransferase [Flavobacteriales bacterium CG_4_9_14_3_um_filter_40_17]|nr:MAG: glycosyltransferase [Flavobacteriales bacterium CG_4_9_14_3_um_filter_40_17]